MANIFAFLESFWCCFAGMKRSFKSTLKRIEVQVIFQVTPNFARFCAVCSNYLINPQNPFATLILLMGGILHILKLPPTFKNQPMHVFAPRTKSTKKPDQTGSFWTRFCQTGFSFPLLAGHPLSHAAKNSSQAWHTFQVALEWRRPREEASNERRMGVTLCASLSLASRFLPCTFRLPMCKLHSLSACISIKHHPKYCIIKVDKY